ncbi:MAG: HRDC domain-containing protein [Alkalibacterium sp.]|nr:HRDC domain-containing protein [Alkalibacterium sp.]
MISIMPSEGYCVLSGDSYPIIQFTEKTSELLQAKVSLSIRKQLKQEPAPKNKMIENIEHYDEELYEELRQLRSEPAQEAGKPPFIVFTDRSLIDMAEYIDDRRRLSEHKRCGRCKTAGIRRSISFSYQSFRFRPRSGCPDAEAK